MTIDFAALNLRSADSLKETANDGGVKSLGQEDFLQLLLTQLTNQDPLDPLDNEAFVAQLAQFSSVSGITEINNSVKTLASMFTANSGASAAQWIGRTIITGEDQSAIVTGVQIGSQGALSLLLDNGGSIAASDVRSIS